MELSVPTPCGGERWHPSVVDHMLTNEKMKGDALLQKSYCQDYLNKKQVKNKGQIPQFYVTGGHEAIVDPELFDHMQDVLEYQKDGRSSGMNPWSSKLVCGKCGRPFRILKRHGKVCWECRDSYKKVDPCKNSYVYETARDWHVKEVMRAALSPEVVEDLLRIINKTVKNPKRREKVKEAVRGFRKRPAEKLMTDDEDFLLAIQEIRFFPENIMMVEFVDGSIVEMEINPCWPNSERKRWK